MDDQGATSSWYALSALGFYPVDPSSQEYIIGSPLFDDASLDMGNGKTLRIVARNNSDTNVYIQSATLDGKPWNKPWFRHDDVKDGARSEEHTSELQSLMRTSYAVFCLK